MGNAVDLQTCQNKNKTWNINDGRKRVCVCVCVCVCVSVWVKHPTARLRDMCCRNQVNRTEAVPQGQRYLAVMYYRGLHLAVRFTEPSRAAAAAAAEAKCLTSGLGLNRRAPPPEPWAVLLPWSHCWENYKTSVSTWGPLLHLFTLGRGGGAFH